MRCDTCHRNRRYKNLCHQCAYLAERWYAELPNHDKLKFEAVVDMDAMEYARKRANISKGVAERFMWLYLHSIKIL